MFKSKYLALLLIPFLAVACGGSGGSGGGNSDTTDEAVSEAPIDVSVENVSLPTGSPVGITYTVPKPAEPYTSLTIDLSKTLESANISVTATP